MEEALQMKDFYDFDESYMNFKMLILVKKDKGKLLSQDLVETFQNLQNSINQLLARVGENKPVIAHGCQSSLVHENLQSLGIKLLSLFESQFVGGEDDKPAHLI